MTEKSYLKKLSELIADLPEPQKKDLEKIIGIYVEEVGAKEIYQHLVKFVNITKEKNFKEFELKFLDIQRKKYQPKKRGRPSSKITRSKFYKDQLLLRYDTYLPYMLKLLSETKYNDKSFLEFSTPKKKKFSSAYLNQLSPIKDVDEFEKGALFASHLIRNILFEIATNEIEEFIELSTQIGDTLRIIDTSGFSEKNKNILESINLKIYPNESVRKIRKPKYSEKEIARFTLTIKNLGRKATLQNVAKELKTTEDEILRYYDEAIRHGNKVEYHKKEKIYVIL